ncbi:MAG TPA: endonuclease/exonuclease/phosphatase family protein [Kiritimatiellia bacterium]|nr:endonuclease/exonuclease/phosphatase family protein [Kiritimatiellia bacterium]
MRFVLYNMCYATGGRSRIFPFMNYLRHTHAKLEEIISFFRALNPDIIGLVEVDAGSYRSSRANQAELIASRLGHYHAYRSKYHDAHLASRLPLMNKQGNAFVTRDSFAELKFHYFTRGIKRLVIELEMENLTIFLVHLALGFKIRHHQLEHLYQLVRNTGKPHIVAGDFNAFWGDVEISLFLAATGLVRAGPPDLPTHPSWAPKRSLDFILHSPRIRPTCFWAPHVTLSDHLPLVCDFEVLPE